MVLADHALSAVALAVALGGTAFAVVLALAALVVARERPSAGQMRAMLRESTAPIEAMLVEVSRSVELARQTRPPDENGVAGAADVDDVLARTVAAARRLHGADAAAVVLERADGEEPAVVTSGLHADQGVDPAGLRLSGPGARAVTVAYRHRLDASPGANPIRAGLGVPIPALDGEPGGILSVFWRDPAREPRDEDVALLEDLARRAAPAIRAALRYDVAAANR